jgi:hypothetical protein
VAAQEKLVAAAAVEGLAAVAAAAAAAAAAVVLRASTRLRNRKRRQEQQASPPQQQQPSAAGQGFFRVGDIRPPQRPTLDLYFDIIQDEEHPLLVLPPGWRHEVVSTHGQDFEMEDGTKRSVAVTLVEWATHPAHQPTVTMAATVGYRRDESSAYRN